MTNLDLIQQRFPNRILLTLGEVCQLIGISTQTAHNRLSQGRFVLPTIKENNRTYIHIRAVSEYLDRIEECITTKPVRRGRPTKVEQKVRRQTQTQK